MDLVPTLQNETLTKFLQKLNEINPKAVILSVVEPFATARISKVDENLPTILSELFHERYENYSLEKLREEVIEMSITDEGRITSSTFKLACKTSIEKPSLSLIKRICYPVKSKFQTKALLYGLKNEKNAIKAYTEYMNKSHQNLKVCQVGFTISTKTSIFGASPDGSVSCDCCAIGCLEIKCPFRMFDQNLNLEQFSKLKGSYLLKDDKSYKLDREHEYYYQIQLHLYTTEKTYCDFVVYSARDLFIERVNLDHQFLIENLHKAYVFHYNVIIPELLAKWYTLSKDSVEQEFWCYCASRDEGDEMLRCANDGCKIKWSCTMRNFPSARARSIMVL